MAKFLEGNRSTKKGQKEDSLHIIGGSIKNCTSRDVKKTDLRGTPGSFEGKQAD